MQKNKKAEKSGIKTAIKIGLLLTGVTTATIAGDALLGAHESFYGRDHYSITADCATHVHEMTVEGRDFGGPFNLVGGDDYEVRVVHYIISPPYGCGNPPSEPTSIVTGVDTYVYNDKGGFLASSDVFETHFSDGQRSEGEHSIWYPNTAAPPLDKLKNDYGGLGYPGDDTDRDGAVIGLVLGTVAMAGAELLLRAKELEAEQKKKR